MSIASAIQTKQQQVSAAYTACNNKGATMPEAENRNLTNLSSTISTIETPIPINQQIQKVICTQDVYTRDCETVSANYTSIPNNKFKNDTTLVAALIPDTVTSFGTSSFQGTSKLKYVNAENVRYLGENAFYGSGIEILTCTDLQSNGLSSYNIFNSASNLKSVNFGGSAVTLGMSIFNKCSRLTYVTLPDTITTIQSSVFKETGNIQDVTLTHIETIGGEATFQYSNIVGFTLGGTYSSIPQFFANNCQKVTSISLTSSNLTTIGNGAFQCCYKLSSLTLTNEENITSIGTNAFKETSSLARSFTFTNLTSLGGEAAFQYSKITGISLNSLTSIPQYSFHRCYSLASVTLSSNLTTIGNNAFGECSALTSINLPESITTLGNNAFYICSFTNQVNLPNLTSMGENAFAYSKITSVTNLGSITTVSGGAFQYCSSLTSVTLPSTVISIGGLAFARIYSTLTSLTILATTPPSVVNSFLLDTYATIYVPAASVSDYQNATGWTSFASRIQAIP